MKNQKFFYAATKIVFMVIFCFSTLFTLASQTGTNEILWGDVDGNGNVNILDALKVAQYSVGLVDTLTVVEAADVNVDGLINIIDALMIARKYVGLLPRFPAELKPNQSVVSLDSPFKIRYGHSCLVGNEGLEITFSGIADSRCPSSVVCVWEGEAVITLDLEKEGTGLGSFELHDPPHEPFHIEVDGYSIEFISIVPYPVEPGSINKTDYVATLVVTRLPVLPVLSGKILFYEGNFMPGTVSGTVTGVAREIFFYEKTNSDDVVQEGYSAFYSQINTQLLKTTRSDSSGNFSVALEAGEYSMFVREKGLYYANGFDGYGNIHVVKVTEEGPNYVNFRINWAAYW